MPAVAHVATIAAYELKAGGFRGVMVIRDGKVRTESGVLETLEQAKFWAKSEAHKAYDANGYSLAAMKKKGEYQANVWVAA